MPKTPEPVSEERKTESIGREILHGAKFTPFDLVGGPVDAANYVLGAAGLDHPEPFLGSDYLINRYSELVESLGSEFRKPTNSTPETVGRLGASLLTGVTGARSVGDELLEIVGKHRGVIQEVARGALIRVADKIEDAKPQSRKISAEEESAFTDLMLDDGFVDEFVTSLKHAAKEGSMEPDIASKLATKILDSGLGKEDQAKMIYRLVDLDPKKARKVFKKDIQTRKRGGLASLWQRVIG